METTIIKVVKLDNGLYQHTLNNGNVFIWNTKLSGKDGKAIFYQHFDMAFGAWLQSQIPENTPTNKASMTEFIEKAFKYERPKPVPVPLPPVPKPVVAVADTTSRQNFLNQWKLKLASSENVLNGKLIKEVIIQNLKDSNFKDEEIEFVLPKNMRTESQLNTLEDML